MKSVSLPGQWQQQPALHKTLQAYDRSGHSSHSQQKDAIIGNTRLVSPSDCHYLGANTHMCSVLKTNLFIQSVSAPHVQ